jgi:hypothetical protein
MLFSNLHFSLLASTVFSFNCSAQPLPARGSGDVFHIYAFGDNISSLQVFYADGNSPSCLDLKPHLGSAHFVSFNLQE